MAYTLQDARREAGFEYAKDFAEHIGMTVSTYARYEGCPESIPLRAAWAIADELGVSIDLVVGREVPVRSTLRGEVQYFYEGLDEEERGLMDGLMSFLVERREKAREEREDEGRRRRLQLAASYERALRDEAACGGPFAMPVLFGDEHERRCAFKDYVAGRQAALREAEVARYVASMEADARAGRGWAAEDGEQPLDPAAEDFEEALAAALDMARTCEREEYEERDAAALVDLMAAYDELHPAAR